MNIIVAGKTGVGKSTLINSVFREELAETGIGRPVTRNIRRISKPDFPLVVYDTKGFELSEKVQREVKDQVMKIIRDGFACKDINKTIHCVWYCVNAASNRIEPEEIEGLRELGNENEMTQVPIIVVLTQCISKKRCQDLRKVIEEESLNIIQVVPVLAKDYEIDDEYVAKSFGLDVLIRVMGDALPDELVDTLQNLQIVSLEEKINRAQAAVVTAVTAATATGASPIPVSDCAVLIPIQITMIAGIAAVFGVELSKSLITSIVTTLLGAGGATLLGKTVVSNLLKFIPGAGSVVGGVISGATAGALTAALGETFIWVMSQIFKGEMSEKDFSTKEGREQMSSKFKEQLSLVRTK
nr:DUF697 domain-containing protein [Enorma phocaeensis]